MVEIHHFTRRYTSYSCIEATVNTVEQNLGWQQRKENLQMAEERVGERRDGERSVE